MSEQVNHPDHYGGDTTYEAIKVIEAWEIGRFSPTSGFNLGNALKYISRLGKKPGADVIADLQKIQWYVNREVQNALAYKKEQEDQNADRLDAFRLALNTALDGLEKPQEPIFIGIDPGAEWTQQPLTEDTLPENGAIPSAAEDAPRSYETPSHDPIINTRFMFDREAGHNVPAYEHASGRISLDGDTTV